MQFFIVASLLAVASVASADILASVVPADTPGCIKYCVRIAIEGAPTTAPGTCTLAGYCASTTLVSAIDDCLGRICGKTNAAKGKALVTQVCSSAGPAPAAGSCPSGSAVASTPVASATDVVTTIGGVATTIPASEVSTFSVPTPSASDVVTSLSGVGVTTVPGAEASTFFAGLSMSTAAAASSASSAASGASSVAASVSTAAGGAASSILSSASGAGASASASASGAASSASRVSFGLGGPVALLSLVLGAAAGAMLI